MQCFSYCDWIISLTLMSLSSPMLSQIAKFSGFIRLNNNPFYVHTVLFLGIYLLMSIKFSFHILAIENNAAIDRVHISLQYLFSLPFSIYSEIQLLDHIVILFSIFWGTSTFSIVFEPIYIPTESVEGFLFLHVLTNISYLLSPW